MSEQRRLHWGIVGGGMLGMTLALRLAQRGERVTLIEAADHLGGLADAWTLGDVSWDRHYHVTLLSDQHLLRLLGELGLEDELHFTETRTGFYTDGQLYSMSNSWEFLRFPPLRLWDKLRLGATIFYASKLRNWQRLEQIPVDVWLKRWSGHRTFERIWLPLLRAKLGENYRHASAAFIWATIARMYAARRTGIKKEMFGYVAGGYRNVISRFANKLEAAGVELRLGASVEQITATAGTESPLEVQCRGESPTALDRVVLTLPAEVASRLCPQLSAEQHERLRQVRYQGILCASVLMDQPLAGFYVTNITDAGIPFTGVIEMTALVDPENFGGKSLVFLPKYVPSDDPAFEWPDSRIESEFLETLERMYPQFNRSLVRAFRVSRVACVMAIPTLDYSTRLPPMKTNVTGLYVINSAHIVNGTLNVNETVKLAEDAVRDTLLTDASPAPSPAPVLR